VVKGCDVPTPSRGPRTCQKLKQAIKTLRLKPYVITMKKSETILTKVFLQKADPQFLSCQRVSSGKKRFALCFSIVFRCNTSLMNTSERRYK
jgi:hypothetical protein